MKKTISLLIVLTFLISTPLFAGSVTIMKKDELKSLLGSENLVILDVRSERDWSASEFKIKDAVRIDNGDLSLVKNYPQNSIFVLYCAWPNEGTSASLAQKLNKEGYKKVYVLKGGWREWYESKLPVEAI